MVFNWEKKISSLLGKLNSYLENVFPNIGKHCGKSLRLDYHVLGSQYSVIELGKLITYLENIFPYFGNIVEIFENCLCTNSNFILGNTFQFWGIFLPMLENVVEIIDNLLGFSGKSTHSFLVGIYSTKLTLLMLLGIPSLILLV